MGCANENASDEVVDRVTLREGIVREGSEDSLVLALEAGKWNGNGRRDAVRVRSRTGVSRCGACDGRGGGLPKELNDGKH